MTGEIRESALFLRNNQRWASSTPLRFASGIRETKIFAALEGINIKESLIPRRPCQQVGEIVRLTNIIALRL